jgi:hypothetical protein
VHRHCHPFQDLSSLMEYHPLRFWLATTAIGSCTARCLEALFDGGQSCLERARLQDHRRLVFWRGQIAMAASPMFEEDSCAMEVACFAPHALTRILIYFCHCWPESALSLVVLSDLTTIRCCRTCHHEAPAHQDPGPTTVERTRTAWAATLRIPAIPVGSTGPAAATDCERGASGGSPDRLRRSSPSSWP